MTVKGGVVPGSWPGPGADPIVFRDDTGARVAPESLTDDTLRALLPNGGSLVRAQDNSASPTSRNVTTWTVNGVRPGDLYDFDAFPPPLPKDCTLDSVGWSVYSGTATWNDSDAQHAVARIARYYRSTAGGSTMYDVETWTVLDGLQSLSLPDGDALQYLTVVHCSSASYDDVRTSLAIEGPP